MQPSQPHCVLCGSRGLEAVALLEPTPPANALSPTRAEARAAAAFPLDLMRCPDCGLLQLGHVVPRDQLFREYKYATGAAPGLVAHFRALANDVVDRVAPAPTATVVEIGSNDGTLLRAFAERGMTVLGVDPAVDLARQAQADGVPTLAAHFDERVAATVLAQTGGADIVLANNVLAHVHDLNGVLRGIRAIMRPTATAVFEVAHLLPMAATGAYEFVYHEHVSYFSMHVLRSALARHGMTVVDVEEVPTQGGSLRCWVRPAAAATAEPSPRLQALLAKETRAGLTDGSLLAGFGQQIADVNSRIADVVTGLAMVGRRVCGYGASARSVTLMAQAGIGDDIAWIVDDNPRKVGWYVPGSGTPIMPSRQLTNRNADYCVLFAWNFAADILRSTRAFGAGGGSFIVPFPTFTVV
jgi:SAM-dependent methyltransferase